MRPATVSKTRDGLPEQDASVAAHRAAVPPCGRICLVGYPKAFLRLLAPVAPPGSVVVLEEPDILEKRGLHGQLDEFAAVGEVHQVAYVGRDDLLAVAERLHADERFDAVVTALEYAVVPTAVLAERLGLPGPGVEAARILCDKRALRRVSAAGGVLNPASAEVGSLADVRRFVREHGGRAGVVLKPANRQASVGVHVLDHRRANDPAQLEEAWLGLLAATDADHLPERPMPVAYLAEERLLGREVSVEALVDDGVVCFVNHTEKWITPGVHPVECGHVVPARISTDHAAALTAATSRLVASIGFGTGVVHAEWMLTDQGPVLIECAGRLPGDRIVELIDMAWNVNFCAAYVELLSGRRPMLPYSPPRGAAVAFLGHGAHAGRVRAVEGAEEARRLSGVADVQITVAPGDWLGPWTSSWDRRGNVLVRADTSHRAAKQAIAAAGLVRFVTEQGRSALTQEGER